MTTKEKVVAYMTDAEAQKRVARLLGVSIGKRMICSGCGEIRSTSIGTKTVRDLCGGYFFDL